MEKIINSFGNVTITIEFDNPVKFRVAEYPDFYTVEYKGYKKTETRGFIKNEIVDNGEVWLTVKEGEIGPNGLRKVKKFNRLQEAKEYVERHYRTKYPIYHEI